ncbi:UDP-N-acetylmuramoyl-tripeptide--D-alanyl-D-alanine ligase [Sorangium sp. So ce363]|uniref:UDP-N-acetylmuramoyl-tripeptide--D-alanyl-D- alanine ligase n=1 Tax=Sorangium sp. So ce363 TaxID=3133304 RepID=UPI003F618079
MATPIPHNLAPFSLDELARATGGRVLRSGPDARGVSTDSRTIAPGAAFVALVGESFDGHRFLDAAAQRGAAAFIVSREIALPPGGGAVLVNDGLAALGALARAHRERWRTGAHPDGPRAIVAIGGSAGKTTTTRTIAALLAGVGRGEVHATAGNLNNAIGLPMTLLGLEDRHRFAVVEIGTNQRGEVAALARIAGPDLAVLTSIGVEHTEGLGTLEDVAAEEGDLLAALPAEGVALGNGDDAKVVEQIERAGAARRITYGFGERAQIRIAGRRPVGVRGTSVRIERGGEALELVVPLLGEAGALAAAAAVAVVEEAVGEPLSTERAARAAAGLAPPGDGRLSVRELPDSTVVIDDSYNANPLSMRSSLRTAVEVAEALGKRLVLLLGEMRELGALAAAEHDALGEQVGAARPAALIAVGGEAARIARAAEAAGVRAWFAVDADAAAARAQEIVERGDLVLVKGSRGIRMERIVNALVASAGRGASPLPSP